MTFTTTLIISAIAVYIAANIIMFYVSINVNGDETVADVLNEQDFGLGKVLGKVVLIVVFLPALFCIYLRSLRPINTEFSFDELNEEDE